MNRDLLETVPYMFPSVDHLVFDVTNKSIRSELLSTINCLKVTWGSTNGITYDVFGNPNELDKIVKKIKEFNQLHY